MFGGVKNHMVVLFDVDFDLVVDVAVSAVYGVVGEWCMVILVVVAVGDAGDKFVDAIVVCLFKLRVGDGVDFDFEMGLLIIAEHRDWVAGYIVVGVELGV